MSRTLTLIDPLTLIGRELTRLIEEAPDPNLAVRTFHTSEEEEHHITEVAGDASIVTPLAQPEDLDGSSVIIVASEDPDARLRPLEDFATLNPQVPVIIAGRAEGFRTRPIPVGLVTRERPDPPWMRIAHPCLVAAQALSNSLTHFEISSMAITALEPISSFGGEAIETLAGQAIARLQGQSVENTIDGHVAAFSTIAVDESQLVEDAAFLWPSAQVTVSRLLSGSFHGHAAQVAVTCEHPVDRNELFEVLEAQPILALAETPFGSDSVVDANQIIVIPGPSSTDGRHLMFTLMMDGLRIGGALTALQIAESVT